MIDILRNVIIFIVGIYILYVIIRGFCKTAPQICPVFVIVFVLFIALGIYMLKQMFRL